MGSKIILACALAALAVPASAFDIYRGEQPKDAFIFIDGSQTSFDIPEESLDDSDGFSLGFGYKLSSTYSWELTYRDLGTVKEDYEYESYRSSFTNIEFSVTGALPISEKVSAYGRLGMSKLKVELKELVYGESDSETVSKNRAVIGVGIRGTLSENTGIRFEYTRHAKWNDLSLSTLSLGLDWSF